MSRTCAQARFSSLARGQIDPLPEKRNPMHDLLIASVFVVMMLLPCLVASAAGTSES
jgi:hypothetical protein